MMSDKAIIIWFTICIVLTLVGAGFLVHAKSDKTSTDLPSLDVSVTATAAQLGKDYLVTLGNISGHTYLFIRLKNETDFVVKHSAGCTAPHPGGFDG